MTSRLSWLKLLFLRHYRKMGLRVLFYALLSLAAVFLGPLADGFLAGFDTPDIALSDVTGVLTILASSMLAVSTFSLNIMVTAYRAAADATTPHVHRILLEDTTTQSVLAAFIGAFVYSLGAIVLIRLEFYAADSAFVIMLITTLVVVIVVISLLRWIEHLTTLGSMEESLRTAQRRARDVLLDVARHPRFGASALTPETVLPTSTTPLRAPCSGFLQLIDMASLQKCLGDGNAVYLDIRPGTHVLDGQVIGQVSGTVDEGMIAGIIGTLTFGEYRTLEQDSEFGLIVLSEIASRALSPGINDSGTAIDATLVMTSILWDYAGIEADDTPPDAPRVFVSFPGPATFVEAAFSQVARDGAGRIEVALTLRKSLATLSKSANPAMAEAARGFAEVAMAHASGAGLSKHNLDRLHAVAVAERE